MNLFFSSPVFNVGALFGNDQDITTFDTMTLSVFDAADTLLGSVSLATNNNRKVDQFIGLNSDTAFVRARFQNGPATNSLSVMLDDVIFDQISTVPEPTTLTLVGLGLFGLGFNRRKRL